MPTINEARLIKLSPTAFENLTFDLIRADSMENVNWRTPGADGGRDIEGELSLRDFAGHTRRSRWLIECKRYRAAVNWPTVWEKVSYADSGQADFLLLVTTGKFSTRCLDEIEKWNKQDRKPAIRVWPRHEVVFRLFLKQSIAAKYGLLDGFAPSAVEVSSLSLHVARMTQAALAHTDPIKLKRYVLAASSLANLLYIRSLDLAEFGQFRVSTPTARESVPAFVAGVTAVDLGDFDWAGLLAGFACIHVIVKEPLLVNKNNDGAVSISTGYSLPNNMPNFALMREIAFWGGFVASQSEFMICLKPQTFA